MPKKVDHDERRRDIAAAVLRLIADRGGESVSLRAVAEEAGVSMGAVQHYFETRDEMLLFALVHANELLGSRLRRAMAAAAAPPGPRELWRLLFTQLLPLDDETRTGARLWAALLARGAVDAATRDLAAQSYANLHAFVADALTRAFEAGEIRADLDLPGAARRLVSTVEGLRWPVLFGVYTEKQALAVLDAELDSIFGF
ncbi:TetR/AcrR family transcriptional regulator [Nocardia sp. BMG51109]|uniref:TetR/AcrR family transcriptional regulator n=1 Tax=Nocardia sp. BMG51109 TaxID=1056816 RepID=UPI000467E00D|nr:TetR/AcrR family transcriptional regulator [Nocardia sp. BMG51109]